LASRPEVYVDKCERSVHHWPLIFVESTLVSENVDGPIAANFLFLQNSNEAFSIEYVWDGANVNL